MEQIYSPLPISEIIEAEEPSSKTYLLDLEKGRIFGRIDGIEAVRQAILKALLTPRFKCLIYTDQYGNELVDQLIINDASPDYITTAAEGFVRDALLLDTRIKDITEFTVELDGDECHISFYADTIFGQTKIEEVL